MGGSKDVEIGAGMGFRGGDPDGGRSRQRRLVLQFHYARLGFTGIIGRRRTLTGRSHRRSGSSAEARLPRAVRP
jgi:hypothetical protein